ncbi:MAG TPA: rhodanese-like domain-containing protein, partial [Gemmatimonadaceae bacterium]|nr:rhodanese-like domain-containing protein [Gemmatimonadaceae bacterium]
PGLLGLWQASEVVKLLTGVGELAVGRLVLVDLLGVRVRTVRVRRDPECPTCGAAGRSAAGERRRRAELVALEEEGGYCQPGLASVSASVSANVSTSVSASGGAAGPRVTPRELTPRELTPTEVAARLARGESLLLLDVREPGEWEIAHIDGARHIPLGRLQQAIDAGELEHARADTVVAYCKSGGRSAAALKVLEAAGFAGACHMAGGITRWRAEVDATLPVY